MGFVPKYDDVVAAKSGVCPEGRMDFSSSGVELKRSTAGAKQIVMRFTVDNGENSGHRVTDYFSFGETAMELSFSRLKAIADAAGMPWGDEVEELEQLAKHFGQQGFRFSAETWHRHQVKSGGTYETVSKEELEAHKAEGGEGNTRVNMSGYEPAANNPEIKVTNTFGDEEKAAPAKKAKARNRVEPAVGEDGDNKTPF